jgi:hypothetical protein
MSPPPSGYRGMRVHDVNHQRSAASTGRHLRPRYAEWLRRRRRINKAKPELVMALEAFRRLGARWWAERTEGELRRTVTCASRAWLAIRARTRGAMLFCGSRGCSGRSPR